MLNFWRKHHWSACLLALAVAGAQAGTDNMQSGRNLNPYHEQQLQSQIRKCASGVLACTDAETRCLKQQDLCQLLIRAERYDEALQVAYNIYKTDAVDAERRAAHHYLTAEIYNRMMKASPSMSEMEKNRQYALSAAQEVVNQKYPSKWQVSERARAMIQDLNDSRYMANVRQRVSSRQGDGDVAKQAIADAQRKYLDATQGTGRSAARRPSQTSNFARVMPSQSKADNVAVAAQSSDLKISSAQALPSKPEKTRIVSPVKYESGEVFEAGSRLNQSGLLTSQPGAPAQSAKRQPIMINGTAVKEENSAEAIRQNNLAQLLEAARKRKENAKSPYATGQLPPAAR